MKNTQSEVMAATDITIVKFEAGKVWVYLITLLYERWKDRKAFPGSQIQITETLETACERVFSEATGDKNAKKNIIYKEQIYTFSDPKRDTRSRCISTEYLAIPSELNRNYAPTNNEKYSQGEWVELDKAKNLAYDHDEMLKKLKKKLATELQFSNLGILLMPKEFTLTDLQSLYEYCWGKKLDKRNFRKKILNMNIVKESGNMKTGDKSRPAKFYTSLKNSFIELDLF